MQVGVVYSLPSKRMLATEYGETDEDSEVIAKTVVRGLQARGMTTTIYPISEDNIESIGEIKADCIFNLIEWCGRDIGLSEKAFGYLRALNIPVTGADERMFVLTGDKIRTKKELIKIDAPTPMSANFVTGEEVIPIGMRYPVIVKPSLEHCSTGLSYDSIANSDDELRVIVKKQIATFEQSILVEEFIVGRELLVYMVEEEGNPRVLPVEEMIFYGKTPLHFQTYETKWNESSDDYNSTDVEIAKLTSGEKEIVETVCKNVFEKLGFRGYARFDIRFRDNTPYILETNANPSVYDAAEELDDVESEVIWGIKFPDYLEIIVKAAFYHFKRGDKI
jgi:D-alanine-D-alanine ligase